MKVHFQSDPELLQLSQHSRRRPNAVSMSVRLETWCDSQLEAALIFWVLVVVDCVSLNPDAALQVRGHGQL